MPCAPPSSKRNARRTQRANPPQRSDSDTTSSDRSSSDPSEISISSDDYDSASSRASDYQPLDLDEPISYTFQNGDPVWVRTDDGEWIQGIISGSSTRRASIRQLARERVQKEGVFFPVAFGRSSRRYFAPLNGDVKPDNAEVRRLLSEGGWL
ncbi:uncharacterized protein LAESUDRAFT_723255 [Laetiporus sulphureus 93-53]|uniref:Uncharacterized protein n=1 Tax=Laetiporus sulphureus 93-53 TaxID=1314785 RepID=A0A165FGX2_9APHY|nr:uncharacterized protein LAESUDRAFT_723255 [Laetiporus sulphureus 93-53]KZT08953.1 hypothetical protein LAESUDRAFT_723255 [Laetiporus sulphureus 93-53]